MAIGRRGARCAFRLARAASWYCIKNQLYGFPAVRFKVYLLRSRGRRLRWREAQNRRPFFGTLVTHYEEHGGERYGVLQLQPSDPMSADRPPPLYEPQLLGFAPIAFRLRGFERIEAPGGGYSVVQEWHVVAG
jgi:hypothetical protein